MGLETEFLLLGWGLVAAIMVSALVSERKRPECSYDSPRIPHINALAEDFEMLWVGHPFARPCYAKLFCDAPRNWVRIR